LRTSCGTRRASAAHKRRLNVIAQHVTMMPLMLRPPTPPPAAVHVALLHDAAAPNLQYLLLIAPTIWPHDLDSLTLTTTTMSGMF
jgi:hypothetical protein